MLYWLATVLLCFCVAACFAVSLINPFGWHTLTAPIRSHMTDYPARREIAIAGDATDFGYFPIASGEFWLFINHASVAGLLMFLAAAVTIVLNRDKVEWAHVLAFVGFLALSLFGARELAPAALVCCVIATLNAQDWYRTHFRQTYSVDTAELLVSELVTNALRYGEGEIRLRLLLDRTLVCEVWDAGLVQPRRRRARDTDEGGRGLQLVGLLSAAWGSRRTPRGKTVWFELPLPGGEHGLTDPAEALLSLF